MTALYRPAHGDTLYNGQPFSTVFPGDVEYAAAATWYINNESITFDSRPYVRYGLPRVLGIDEVERIGSYQGIGVYGEAGMGGLQDAIYIPLRPGCEFQPYLLASSAEGIRDGPDASPPVPSPRHPRATTSAPAPDSLRQGEQPPSLRPGSETGLGSIETRMPRRFRQGKPELVRITLLLPPVSERTETTAIDTLRYDGGPAPTIALNTITVIRDTTTLSRRVRIQLLSDSADGTAFLIDPNHGTAEQLISDDIPANWTFRVTPLKGGLQRLYIAMDLLTASGESHLPPIIKPVDVQVDTWWSARRWIRLNIAPVLVGSILIPLIGFFGVRLFRRNKEN